MAVEFEAFELRGSSDDKRTIQRVTEESFAKDSEWSRCIKDNKHRFQARAVKGGLTCFRPDSFQGDDVVAESLAEVEV